VLLRHGPTGSRGRPAAACGHIACSGWPAAPVVTTGVGSRRAAVCRQGSWCCGTGCCECECDCVRVQQARQHSKGQLGCVAGWGCISFSEHTPSVQAGSVLVPKWCGSFCRRLMPLVGFVLLSLKWYARMTQRKSMRLDFQCGMYSVVVWTCRPPVGPPKHLLVVVWC
jgi:hypothetical protein